MCRTLRRSLIASFAHMLVRGGVLSGLHLNLIYNLLDVGNSPSEFLRIVPLRSGLYATLQNERPIRGTVRDALVVQILMCLQRCFVIVFNAAVEAGSNSLSLAFDTRRTNTDLIGDDVARGCLLCHALG